MAPFFGKGGGGGGGFEPLLPQMLFDFAEIAEILNRGSLLLPVRKTHCLKHPSKFLILAQMECSFINYNFGSFCWGPIYHSKTKKIA